MFAYCTRCVRNHHQYEVTLRLLIGRNEDLIYLTSNRPMQPHTEYPVLAKSHEDAKFITDSLVLKFWHHCAVACCAVSIFWLIISIIHI